MAAGAEGTPLLLRREAHLSTGRQRALLGAVIGLGCAALLAAVVVVGREDVARAVLAEELPQSVTDISGLVDVEGKKSYLNDVFTSSQGGQVLHPTGVDALRSGKEQAPGPAAPCPH